MLDVTAGEKQNIAFVVETMYPNIERVYCHLILTNDAYEAILADTNRQVVKVEQFYYDVLQKQFVEIY